MIYENKIIPSNDELKKLVNRDVEYMKNYKKKTEEMKNEKIRIDYSKFSIEYKNINEWSNYRYTRCGQKKLEKLINNR
jgi:hypothetical protein